MFGGWLGEVEKGFGLGGSPAAGWVGELLHGIQPQWIIGAIIEINIYF